MAKLDNSLVALLKCYTNLNPVQQRILQIAALGYYVDIQYSYYGSGFNYQYSSLRKSLLMQLQIDGMPIYKGKPIEDKEFTLILQSLVKLGFFNAEYQIRRALLFPLSKMACDVSNPINTSINLALITSSDKFKLLPDFESYSKFDPYSYGSLDKNDYASLNFAIHSNNEMLLTKKWGMLEQSKILMGYRVLFYNLEPDDVWIRSRSDIFQRILCVTQLNYDLGYAVAKNPERKYWLNLLASLPIIDEMKNFPLLSAQINQLYLITHNYSAITQQKSNNAWAKSFVTATNSLVQQNNKEALKNYELSIREFSLINNRDYWMTFSDASILYTISLIREQKYDKLNSTILKRLDKFNNLSTLSNGLFGIYSILNNDFDLAQAHLLRLKNDVDQNINGRDLNTYAIYLWLENLLAPQEVNWGTAIQNLSSCQGSKTYLAEALIAELILQHDADFALAQSLLSSSPYVGLNIADLIQVKAEWEYSIDKLATLLHSNQTALSAAPTPDKRLAWFVAPLSQKIRVLEQSLRKNGQWTAGKEVTPTRLFKKTDLEYMEYYDNQATLALQADPYHRGHYLWDFPKLLLRLIGHQVVYDYENPSVSLELIAESPVLDVKSTKGGYVVKLSPLAENELVYVQKISASKYNLIEFNTELVQLAKLLGKNGLSVPENAKARLLDVICKTTPSVKINADIVDDNIETQPAKPECLVQLTPNSDGLTLNILVTPFNNGSYYFPAQGINNQVSLNSQGKHVKLVRNFKHEKTAVTKLIEACPILKLSKQSEFEWQYGDLEESLQLLSELHAYKLTSGLVIEWPKGESLKFAANVSASSVKIKVKSQQQWFEYDGEVQINETEVVSLKALLGLLESDNSTRFVQMDDGKFIALSENLKRQLNELKLLSDGDKIFNLGSSALEELVDEASEAKVDKKWQDHIKNIQQRTKFIPQLPSTLQAELRDYQVEGFNYLSRLTNWGIGACLADDMGLGKTIQAIALLLEQAPKGASLVVAPTSVCFNWVEELAKFAPSLNVFLMHNENDRAQLIEKLGAMDVLICSYNLLQQDDNGCADKAWNLLILDEAQAIKNHTTKRFKAVCELNAERRVILSGTPIENHLGELWSLFRFLNPGLLGSIDKFQKKFITPISNKNQIAKQALKSLVYPYILRRTKTQVLSELPPKIEQSIYIEPSSEELAFYEAIRQRAMDNLANLNTAENKRFSILAEITRLRQACCHSSLVDENIKLENSKLAAFLELVQELIENKHKVLVFSQYVRYLEIVQQTLRENNIRYQYIDGAVPINQRKTAVTEFQSGNGGDVFLISLKAGGTGLNLTAADYVIILDPWWNPAVEDQAADRAHRMGQQRPVTVYRLIMKNSIEEKIIHMHKDKRDLAGDLLSGQDIGNKLSEDDLLNLMKL